MSTVNVGRLDTNNRLNIPSYNQAQIDALDVETGMVVWNSTEEQVQFYYGEWSSISGTFSGAGAGASATGGSMQEVGGYMVHFFSGTDTFSVIGGDLLVEYLLVGGGGGAGMDMGGGGGGGGVLSGTTTISEGSYIASVGQGGPGAPAGATNGQPSGHQFSIGATEGQDTHFNGLIAKGGGTGGSSYYNYSPESAGGNGGSGGGASGYSNGSYKPGGQGTSGQGKNGGRGGPQYYSGGGGGSKDPGINSTGQPNGGDGITSAIMGVSYAWGGGGGGAAYSGPRGGNGGNGGGGGGAKNSGSGGDGINPGSAGGSGQQQNPGGNAGSSTGGGGGGGSHYSRNNKGGNGGSGAVIIRYQV